MPEPVTVTLEHDKQPDELRRRIDENIDELTSGVAGRVALKVNKRWEGDTLHFDARVMMQTIKGTIEMFPQHVRITVWLPAFLAGMANKVADRLQKSGGRMLEDKRA